jgi:DNA-binding NarL/FixJ family response regulator
MDVPVAVLELFIISGVRFLRDSLAEILGRVPALHICGEAAGLAEAITQLAVIKPDILLLDAGICGGTATAQHLREAAPGSRIIVIGVGETVENVLAWAEAGIAGYVPNTASIDELILLIGQISHGEQPCPSRIAGSLLRRIAAGAAPAGAAPAGTAPAALATPLTGREQEIYRLVGAGLSNKDIARRLRISLGTTKSHVHNLLGKLSLQRRADVMARAHGADRVSQ